MNYLDDNNQLRGIFLALGALIFVAFCLWLMKTFNVPMNIAFETGTRLFIWVIVAVALIVWQFYSELNVIKLITPLMISLFWYNLIPMLNYTAGVRGDIPLKINIEWYGNLFWQIMVFLLINIIGYGIIYFLNKRND